jgi:hypothetical protein
VAGSAKVSSLDGIRDFRAALIEFKELAVLALGEAEADLQRTLTWLKSDREHHWAGIIKKCQNEVQQAKSDLFRKQLQGREGERPSCIDEKKALEAAERRLLDAQHRLEATKRWQRLLDRELTMYKGQVQQFARALEGDLPKAVTTLDKMLDSLDKYVRLAAPNLDDPQLKQKLAALEQEDEEAAQAAKPAAPQISPYAALRMNSPGRGQRDGMALSGRVEGGVHYAMAPEDLTRLKGLNPAPDAPDEFDKVVLGPEVLGRVRLYLERLEFSSHGDSGWYVGASPCDPPGAAPKATSVQALLARRPDFAEVLNLPRGWLAVVEEGRIVAVLNVANRDVWGSP